MGAALKVWSEAQSYGFLKLLLCFDMFSRIEVTVSRVKGSSHAGQYQETFRLSPGFVPGIPPSPVLSDGSSYTKQEAFQPERLPTRGKISIYLGGLETFRDVAKGLPPLPAEQVFARLRESESGIAW